MECECCCENMTQKLRKPVTCNFCEETCCLVCFKKYLTTQENPNCMFCKKTINLSFISENTPKSFYNNEYRKCRAKILQSKERSLLPETQNDIKGIKELDAKKEKCKVLKKKRTKLIQKLKKLRSKIREMEQDINKGIQTVEKKKFIMKCSKPNCRGFLSDDWKCGTCDSITCKKCHTVVEENHVCKKEDIDTAKLILKETKPCPKCGVRIYKINGCDQMWCVECKTPFSWKTGRIETGIIHNPHYYQWKRDMNNGVAPRNVGDNHLLGALPNWSEIVDMLLILNPSGGKKIQYIGYCHRLANHIVAVEIPRYTPQNNNLTQVNKDLRIKYLKNLINDKEWLNILKRRQKKEEKEKDIKQIFEMFVNVISDIFNNFMIEPNIDLLINQIDNIKKYINEEFEKIGQLYSNKSLYIDKYWALY